MKNNYLKWPLKGNYYYNSKKRLFLQDLIEFDWLVARMFLIDVK